jgi:hypothetical protein
VQLYALETDHVLRGRRGCGLEAKLGAADGWVLSQLDVWVLRVEGEADVAGWWTRTTLVVVGHVEEIISKGVVIVLAEAGEVGVTDDDVGVGDGEDTAVMEQFAYFSDGS